MSYDALVVGGGIGGMESSLKLADMGYNVLLVEKEPSVGGRMILLSKVFPTLDCASCISGPKMSSTINHPRITSMTYSEVTGVRRNHDGTFQATVRKKAKFVDWAACTGCQDCEIACTVAVPDQFNADLVPRRAAYIAFPQAVPKKAVIERSGTSPCTFGCPAGIKAHGYVSLIRSGRFEEAFQLVLDATPLVGTLGRACYAPCEAECTRDRLEGTLPIRRLKRFIAERHYATMAGPGLQPGPANGKSVAIVGSGPAGLTAAFQLARTGYRVKVFEAAPEPGGFLRQAIPVYRLPKEVVDQDIANVTALGVEIATNAKVEDAATLHDEGFDAVLLATGTPHATAMEVPGEELGGVRSGLEFLSDVRFAKAPDLKAKRVVVVGGGNVAMDAARTALRLGAARVLVVYRRGRAEMPAHESEIEDAEHEGVDFAYLTAPVEVTGTGGDVAALRCVRMRLGEPDESGRRRPVPIAGSETAIPCDVVIPAIGLTPDTAWIDRTTVSSAKGGVAVDPTTLATKIPWLFAAGDVVSGPSDITHAIGQGRRAAHMIDRYLFGHPLEGFDALDARLSETDKEKVLGRQSKFTPSEPAAAPPSWSSATHPDFSEIESAMTEPEALVAAGRCLDCGVCSECNQCVTACPADAIHLADQDELVEIDAGAVVVSTGFKLFAADAKPEYGWGTFPNVITAMQMERLLAPTRPFNTVLRPSDGKVPDRIAYISCTGSRDETVGNPLCSKICCMYSIKQNQLIMGALPLADVTMHYMDIRAAGKRYDEFYEQAKSMGATYVKGRVAKVTETSDNNLVLQFEDIENGGKLAEAEYDLVVLAVGVQPNRDAEKLFSDEQLALDDSFFVAEPTADWCPGETSIPGVFVAGAASGAKDIVDSILHAGATAAQVAAHLEQSRLLRRMQPLEEVSA